MSAILEGFKPMAPAANKKLRIEHVYTGGSTVEPLPYLVDAQRRSDRRAGRNTWVLMGSSTDEYLFVRQLRSILSRRAREEGSHDDDDEGRWGVRCTLDMKDLSPKDDCVVVTTLENVLDHLMDANGATPRQFSNKMTLLLYQGWGNLTLKEAYACNKLVKFALDDKGTSKHIFCTISSSETGSFNQDWVTSQQDCRVIMGDETSQPIIFTEDTDQPLVMGDETSQPIIFTEDTDQPLKAVDQLLQDLRQDKKARAIIRMEYTEALELDTFGGKPKVLEEHCHVLSSLDSPEETWKKLSDTSRHIITNGREVTYLGDIPGITHVIFYPLREGSVWHRESAQVVVDAVGLVSQMPELRHAMCWRDSDNAPAVHYLAPGELYETLQADPMDQMVCTSHFDNHVLSSVLEWPSVPVADLPLKCGVNPNLMEHRLRRLTVKGLLERDEAAEPRPLPWGLPRYCSSLKLTPLGRVVSELVSPYTAAVDSAHAACLIGQLVLKMTSASAAVKDAVCSLATVLTTRGGITYIDSVIKPKENFKRYTDNEDSVASELCPRGPIWLAVCVWHFTLVDDHWKEATTAEKRQAQAIEPFVLANSRRLTLWYRHWFKWEAAGQKIQRFFDGCGVGIAYAGVEHKLSAEELLGVEVMLVTAFLDKLAFVYVPARDGAFGYSMTTRTELSMPSGDQMRLINLEKRWEEDKAAVGRETPGVYCIFTHCRMCYQDGVQIAMPYDLTYVSSVAVRRALDRIKSPAAAGDVFSKIVMGYML